MKNLTELKKEILKEFDDLWNKITEDEGGEYGVTDYCKYNLRRWIENSLDQISEETYKAIVTERDDTPDSDEYETADRMAWNSCIDNIHSNYKKFKEE